MSQASMMQHARLAETALCCSSFASIATTAGDRRSQDAAYQQHMQGGGCRRTSQAALVAGVCAAQSPLVSLAMRR